MLRGAKVPNFAVHQRVNIRQLRRRGAGAPLQSYELRGFCVPVFLRVNDRCVV
jgi:hypothetical protein